MSISKAVAERLTKHLNTLVSSIYIYCGSCETDLTEQLFNDIIFDKELKELYEIIRKEKQDA